MNNGLSISQRVRSSFLRSVLLVTLLFCWAGTGYCLVVWANNGEDKVARDELRATADPAGVINSIWDGNRIHLFGGRNETVSFCLILESAGEPTANISVAFDTLTGSGGTHIHSIPATGAGVFNWVNRPIELFYVRYLQIRGLGKLLFEDYDERHVPARFRRPWTGDGFAVAGTGWNDRPDHDKYYPEIAVPLELENPFTIPGGRNQAIWVDVYIPKNSPPGRYTGTVQITASGLAVTIIPVTLDVRNFTLPDDPSLKTMVALGYEDINQRYVHPDRPYPWETANLAKSSRIIDKHFQLAHRHRISLISAEPDPYEQDYPDPHWLPRLSGSLFTAANGYDGPGVGTGNTIFSIGTYSSWYWKGQGEAAMRTHTNAWADWFDTHAPDTDYFLYLIDESDNFPQIEQWASWINNNPGTGKRVQSFATLSYEDGVSLTPSLNIPCAGGYKATTAVVEAAVQQIRADPAKRLWWYNGGRPYTGTFSTMDDGVALRVLAWSQFKKHIERWFYWSATYYNNYQGGTGQTNVFESAFTFGAKNTDIDPIYGETGWNYSNGDGVLFYPGTDLQYPQESYNLEGPFAGLRLKHWRRGLQDGDYLTLAAAVDPAAVEGIVARMLPKALWEYGVSEPSDPTYVRTDISWSIDPDDWEAARRQLADIIETGQVPVTVGTGSITPAIVPLLLRKHSSMAGK